MSGNFYDILGVTKTSTIEEIKKAYRKKAMQYHPDRNKGDKEAEKKFKEISNAYETLSDENKRKNYDMFGKSQSGSSNNYNTGNYSQHSGNMSDFEDLFSSFGGKTNSGFKSSGFDFEDLFGSGFSQNSRKTNNSSREEVIIDIEKVYEIPIFDLILGCKIEVEGFLGQKAKLKIPEYTKPGTKFRVKDFGKTIGNKKGNLIVIVDVRMPKNMSDIDKKLLENIRDKIIY